MSSWRSIPTVDIISILPDSIICHILSFLPTKQAAATSILSKRWNPLWLSVPILDFDQQNFRDFATFRHFVYSVMLLRNITLPIQSFRLKYSHSFKSGFHPHDVNRFIHAVAQRGIQNLNLESYHFELPLPLNVYNCTTLIVHKLKRISIHLFKVNFPLLKTLHLEDIRSSLLRPKFLKRFLYGCPVLEELQLQDVVLLDYKYGKFDGLLKLVKANIFNSTTSNWNFPFAWIRNAKFLCVKLRRPCVCQVSTSLNLTHLKIIFERTNDWLGKWKWTTEVLQNCSKLQNLTIHEDSSDGDEIGDDDWVDPLTVPKCLSLELRTCSLVAIKGRKCELQFVEYILKNAKALHTMKVSASVVDLKIKHQMLRKLSLCPRGSTTCKLSFD